jgi:hypothetical protein
MFEYSNKNKMKFYKNKTVVWTVLFITQLTTAQLTSNIERFTGQGVGGSLFAQMRKVKDIKSDLPTVGSVYIDETFQACKIYYNEELVGNFYYRHNSFNDEIEIKDSPTQSDEEVSSLMAMRQLKLVDAASESELGLHVYQTKGDNLRNGYLYLLQAGKRYNLYFKNNVKYTEGTHPVTSLTRPTPNKFSHFVEYYIKTNGQETAQFIGKKSADFVRLLDEDNRTPVRDYIKAQKISLKDQADLLKLMTYIESL